MIRAVFILPLVAAVVFAEPAVVNSFAAPADDITGLAYGAGNLFAVGASKTVYRMDPADGTVLGSFVTTVPSSPNGLGYAGSLLYVTNGTSTVYKYTATGTAQGSSILYCSG
jgi:hypothetical protein